VSNWPTTKHTEKTKDIVSEYRKAGFSMSKIAGLMTETHGVTMTRCAVAWLVFRMREAKDTAANDIPDR